MIDTFSGQSTPNANFERPAYNELGMKDEAIQKVRHQQELVENKFKNHFSASYGQVGERNYPKRFVGLPFDIQPCPIEAPSDQ